MLNYSESVTFLSLPAKQKPQHSKAKFIAPMAVACLVGGLSSIAPALAQRTIDLIIGKICNAEYIAKERKLS